MEVYNTLAREFHDINTPRNHLVQVSSLLYSINESQINLLMLELLKKCNWPVKENNWNKVKKED